MLGQIILSISPLSPARPPRIRRPPVSIRSITSSSATSRSARAGIKIVDLAIKVDKRVDDGTSSITCTLVKEIKAIYDDVVTVDRPPVRSRSISSQMRKKTCQGMGQAMAYLVGAYQAVGTFLGMVMIGSRFARMLMVDADTMIVEVRQSGQAEPSEETYASLPVGPGSKLWARDLLVHPGLLNLLPNHLLGAFDPLSNRIQLDQEATNRLWTFHHLAWRVAGDLDFTESQPLRRLPHPPQAFIDELDAMGFRVVVGDEEQDEIAFAARTGEVREREEASEARSTEPSGDGGTDEDDGDYVGQDEDEGGEGKESRPSGKRRRRNANERGRTGSGKRARGNKASRTNTAIDKVNSSSTGHTLGEHSDFHSPGFPSLVASHLFQVTRADPGSAGRGRKRKSIRIHQCDSILYIAVDQFFTRSETTL